MKTYAQADFWQFCLFLEEEKSHETQDGQIIYVSDIVTR